ncbi:site-specific integrase [Micromonospora sp. WMMD1155]|uniref:site-specific integrase n=1 Tax=Micromonospora sp. WMMD1155 TaxID=3016094 RepID=UPI00249A0CD6|nr:site-specific integrase [Micromonospora sp. WMMD1155]WFE55234.1 site-specific integrase [Micromonospora sp. WMMD1155]
MPTFAEYINLVSESVTAGTRRVYWTYWQKVQNVWGDRRLDEVSPLEIRQLAERIKGQVVIRRNSRGGRTAAEHLISSLRCLYARAVADGLLAESDNPARRVPKPRRLASTRRALSDDQLELINGVAATTGNDPDLDSLLLRLHIETACRRGGGLALRLGDIDFDQCVVQLQEKGETVRWQPVSPTLASRLRQHALDRGCNHPQDSVLRYRNGAPITHRRHDYLWQRLGKHLPWVRTHQISTHWLRHTTLTWVERRFGYAVAQAYAGHAGRADASTTSTYVRADIFEVAQALVALSGEPHPLLASSPRGETLEGRAD